MTWVQYVNRVQKMILECRTLREIRDLLGQPPPLPPKEERRKPGRPRESFELCRVPAELFEAWDAGLMKVAGVARLTGRKWETCKRALEREKAFRLIAAMGGEVPTVEVVAASVVKVAEEIAAEPAQVVRRVARVPPVEPASVVVVDKMLEPRWVVMGVEGQPTGWFPSFYLAATWQADHGGEILPCRPWPGGGIEIEDIDEEPEAAVPGLPQANGRAHAGVPIVQARRGGDEKGTRTAG